MKRSFIQEVIKMDAAISKTNDRLNFVSQDRDFLHEYHMRAMAMSDWTSGVYTAQLRTKCEIAKNLLTEGLPMELIQRTTGLDIETIQSLKP